MGKTKEHPQSGVGCGQPDGHRDHMCLLMEKGMVADLAERTRKPQFSCANCQALADHSEDLCRPLPWQQK